VDAMSTKNLAFISFDFMTITPLDEPRSRHEHGFYTATPQLAFFGRTMSRARAKFYEYTAQLIVQ